MTQETSLMVSAYRCAKKDELFLFVPQGTDLSSLPETLRVMLGNTSHVIDFELSPSRSLAKEDPIKVLANLQKQGYHLQMPPTDAERQAREAALLATNVQ